MIHPVPTTYTEGPADELSVQITLGGSPTVADLLWRMPVLASLAGAKLKLAGFAGFAGCANTLHARGPTNLKSPSLICSAPLGRG